MEKAAGGGSSRATTMIDGSRGEGGGQILRNAISYAAILRKEIHIRRIRAGRSKPGLLAQHLSGLQLAAAISGGTLHGDCLGSTEIHYRPVELLGTSVVGNTRTIRGEIKTAGSICLLLQAALPCALFCPTECDLLLTGGTNASMAPQYDYWETVFLPTLHEQCGLDSDQVRQTVVRRGFFPKGGGKVEARVKPLTRPLRPLQLTERGRVAKIFIKGIHAGGMSRKRAELMTDAARSYLMERLGGAEYHTDIVSCSEKQAIGSGSGILIVAITDTGIRLAGSSVGTPKKSAEEVGLEAARELTQTLDDGGCVDEWLQDQLILYAALADGVSEILAGSLTLHTQTAIMIAEEVTSATFDVTKLADEKEQGNAAADDTTEYGKDGRIPGRHLIRCHGIGLKPSA